MLRFVVDHLTVELGSAGQAVDPTLQLLLVFAGGAALAALIIFAANKAGAAPELVPHRPRTRSKK